MKNTRLRILILCQILYWSTVIVGLSIASIVGSTLSSNPAFSTLPLTAITVGNILTTLPLSLIMQRFGRRIGFSIGALSSVIGGVISCWAIYTHSFWLFCVGNLFLGISQASALYYRLAATDSVSPNNRGKAIAWVMSGGIIAALLAPSLALWSKDLLPEVFVGSYALVTFFGLCTMILCLFLPRSSITTIPPTKNKQKTVSKRTDSEIIRQPIFITAISNTAVSHAVMILIMVSTPLAMLCNSYQLSDATHVIQWHVLGMFLPSFFVGRLIDRFGTTNISLLGMLILTISIFISMNGIALLHFYSGLFLLGVGWNLMYTSGSTMITESHLPEEKGRVQGLAELIVSSFAALATLSSGALIHHFGWVEVNIGSIPLLLIAAGVTLWFKRQSSS